MMTERSSANKHFRRMTHRELIVNSDKLFGEKTKTGTLLCDNQNTHLTGLMCASCFLFIFNAKLWMGATPFTGSVRAVSTAAPACHE